MLNLSGMKKIFRWVIACLLVVVVALFAFWYWGIYEKGVISGKVLSIAEKGVIFKTYEGKINVEAFGALKDVSPIAGTVEFSVEKDKPEVVKQLEEAALSGERVNLHFIQRYRHFFWRGDTKYFVREVERGKTSE